MQVGKASLRFEHPAFVASWASVAGKKEGQGPLADEIDVKEQDEMFGMENWEQAESAMQKQAADLALEKGNKFRCSAFTEPALPWERRWDWGPCA